VAEVLALTSFGRNSDVWRSVVADEARQSAAPAAFAAAPRATQLGAGSTRSSPRSSERAARPSD